MPIYDYSCRECGGVSEVLLRIPEGERYGYDAGFQSRPESMAEAILDCQVLIAVDMGWGAYEVMQGYGIETIATDV